MKLPILAGLLALALASPALAQKPTFQPQNASNAMLVTPYNSGHYPHDWTEGTGTLGSSGLITLPSPVAGNTQRRWLYIQNQSAATITVQYEARLANGTTQSFGKILLAPGTAAGTQGSGDERGFAAYVPQGIVTISGAANAQVAVMEVVE
jgi:hypothetical protein